MGENFDEQSTPLGIYKKSDMPKKQPPTPTFILFVEKSVDWVVE